MKPFHAVVLCAAVSYAVLAIAARAQDITSQAAQTSPDFLAVISSGGHELTLTVRAGSPCIIELRDDKGAVKAAFKLSKCGRDE